jgi:hypothetical protein
MVYEFIHFEVFTMLEVAWISGDDFDPTVHPERFGDDAKTDGEIMTTNFGVNPISSWAPTSFTCVHNMLLCSSLHFRQR